MKTGYIYKIYNNKNGDVYYGSTSQSIQMRMCGHRAKYKHWCKGIGGNCKSYIILADNDFDYSLVEKIEYDDKIELHQRERWWIENNVCINKNVPSRTDKEYKQENQEVIRQQKKAYNEANREAINAKLKQYRLDNKDKITAYNEANRDKINARRRELRAEKKAQKEINI